MADIQQWQALYAFSVRNAIDLAKSGPGNTGVDITSVTNTGWVRGEGTNHFVATTTGQVTGFVDAAGTKFFALPLTNRPSWAPNQEYVEADKAIGEVAPTAGVGYNYLRGIIGPTGSIEFEASPRMLIPFLWGLVHYGAAEGVSAQDSSFTFALPSSTASSVEAYISALRKFSTTSRDSQVLSDSVVTRMSFSSSEGGALEVSCDLLGRFLDDDFVAGAHTFTSEPDDESHNAPSMNFMEENPLLHQNMDCVIQVGTSYIVAEIASFDLTVTCEIVPKRYNNKFPIRYVIGGFTIEGSLSIPWGATSAGGNKFLEDLINSSDVTAVDVDLTAIDFTWKATRLAIDTTYTSTTINTVARLLAIGDFRLAVGALITDVSVEGEDESMLNVSFQGVNIRTANVVSQPAFGAYMRLDCGTVGYGIP